MGEEEKDTKVEKNAPAVLPTAEPETLAQRAVSCLRHTADVIRAVAAILEAIRALPQIVRDVGTLKCRVQTIENERQ